MGAWGKCCGSRNLFSRQQKPAPELPQRQPETVAATLCEVAPHTMKQPLDKHEFASSARLFYAAKKEGVS
jgi:hypothetical protein